VALSLALTEKALGYPHRHKSSARRPSLAHQFLPRGGPIRQAQGGRDL